jgi:hypothetical protein
LVHLDDDARHRLRVSSDQRDLLIGHRFRFLAEQLPTARDRDRLRPSSVYSTNSNGRSREREGMTIRVVLGALKRADLKPARQCTLNADAGVSPTAIRVT